MYQLDPNNGDIVINGFEKGIGASPYQGFTDLKSVNISGVPGEASVNFSTQSVLQNPSYPLGDNVSAAAQPNGVSMLISGIAPGKNLLEVGQAIVLSNSTIANATTGILYYVTLANKQSVTSEIIGISNTYGATNQLSLGTTGTAILSTIDIATPKFFASMNPGIETSSGTGATFMLDSNGRVWSDFILTSGGTSIPATNSWTYTGNNIPLGGGTEGTLTGANGNGLVYWRTGHTIGGGKPGDWDGWLFVFRDGNIDYSNVNGVIGGASYNHVGIYTYGWNITSGTTGTATDYLTGSAMKGCPHNAIAAPDGSIVFCDLNNMWHIKQAQNAAPTITTFNPADNSTYITIFAQNLPINEIATCVAPLGTQFIIGGRYNQAYIWNGSDLFDYSNPILLPEPFVSQIITVNTNAYLFAGNRGNIYITNGSQASPWAKIPDHLSTVPEPYFRWGGAVYQKNKLYFGVSVTDNAGTAINGYGGIWEANVHTNALCLSNQLSNGGYTGYASALYAIPPQSVTNDLVQYTVFPVQPTGVGLFAGWADSSVTPSFGLDKTISAPYTGGQPIIISDMIPVGTLFKQSTPLQFEFKLAKPLLTGESVELQVGSTLGGTFTSAGTVSGDGTLISGNLSSPVQGLQWLQLKAILTGKASSPSYNRITELRIIGSQQKTL